MPGLYEQLIKYSKSDAYPFHMPGHKRRLGSLADPYSFDLTEIDGFDNLHHAEGVLLEVERRAAALYGSEEAHLLVNGSTGGILSAIGACTKRGGRILFARASHKAAYHALALGDLDPVYLTGQGEEDGTGKEENGDGQGEDGRESDRCDAPFLPPDEGACGRPIRPAEVERILKEDRSRGALAGAGPEGRSRGSFAGAGPGERSRIQAVYLTSPTYDGRISDVRGIAEVAHRYGIPLIVDEAHGAHFGMSPIFPPSSVSLGADLVIHSLHKTLPALTQTALIHVQGKLVDRRRLREMLDIYQTSSPSYVLMASIDRCLGILEDRGADLFRTLAKNLTWFYDSVRDLRQIGLIRTDDPSKILLKARESSAGPGRIGMEFAVETGPGPRPYDPRTGLGARPYDPRTGLGAGPHDPTALYDLLRLRYGLQPEMKTRDYVLMLCSVGDDREGFERLSAALHEIDLEWERQDSAMRRGTETERGQNSEGLADSRIVRQQDAAAEAFPTISSQPERILTIGQAMDVNQEPVPFPQSTGRVFCEYLYLYPPGIPLIVPGERMTRTLADQVTELMQAGYEVEGACDHSLKTVFCMAEKAQGERAQGEDQEKCAGKRRGRPVRHLFYLMGKSASGKDTIYEELLKEESLGLKPLVPWTTRPIRDGEVDGQEYHFTDRAGLKRMQDAGKVIEQRTYSTILGPWTYFTVDDGTLDRGQDLLGIGTLESYRQIRAYYGQDRVVPLYIQVDDGLRLQRALKREMKPGNQHYEEMCRRFLADQEDFREEKLEEAGISRRYQNDQGRAICIAEVTEAIRQTQEGL